MYLDRADAGRRLADALDEYRDQRPVIVALPRGGVVVGCEVASALGAPLEILVVRKIPAPQHPELGIGAVVEVPGASEPAVVLDELARRLEVPADYLNAEIARQVGAIRRRELAYRGGRVSTSLLGRLVILVDDGIATGSTVRAALQALRRCAVKRIVLAVPVGPRETLEEMRAQADEVVCLLVPEGFRAVGEFYEDFGQTTDEQVIALLARAWRPTAA